MPDAESHFEPAPVGGFPDCLFGAVSVLFLSVSLLPLEPSHSYQHRGFFSSRAVCSLIRNSALSTFDSQTLAFAVLKTNPRLNATPSSVGMQAHLPLKLVQLQANCFLCLVMYLSSVFCTDSVTTGSSQWSVSGSRGCILPCVVSPLSWFH